MQFCVDLNVTYACEIPLKFLVFETINFRKHIEGDKILCESCCIYRVAHKKCIVYVDRAIGQTTKLQQSNKERRTACSSCVSCCSRRRACSSICCRRLTCTPMLKIDKRKVLPQPYQTHRTALVSVFFALSQIPVYTARPRIWMDLVYAVCLFAPKLSPVLTASSHGGMARLS